jgi:hypothetical protein
LGFKHLTPDACPLWPVPPSRMMHLIAPQLARATSDPPTGSEWVHEVKHDGHRVIAYVDRGTVRLITRNGNDATRRFSPLAAMIKQLSARQAIIGVSVRRWASWRPRSWSSRKADTAPAPLAPTPGTSSEAYGLASDRPANGRPVCGLLGYLDSHFSHERSLQSLRRVITHLAIKPDFVAGPLPSES